LFKIEVEKFSKTMNLSKTFLYSLVILSIGLSNCDLEKSVDLELPVYENQMVIECYLEVGKPMVAVISESVGFFSSPDLPLLAGAEVNILHRGFSYELKEGIFIDTTTAFPRFFNYGTGIICPSNYNEDFTIEVRDAQGRIAFATTQILEPVPIDTLEVIWKEDSPVEIGLIFTRFFDPPATENFYRRTFQKGSILGMGKNEQDFTTTDNFADDNNQIVFGTDFNFYKNDTVISTIYNIDKAYYDFRESIQNAISSNGNPFGQPGVIKSNIEGGIGIFTGISFDRKVMIIE